MNPQAPLMRVIDSADSFAPQQLPQVAPELPPELTASLAPDPNPNPNPNELAIQGLDPNLGLFGPPQPVEFQLTPERKKLLNLFSMYRYSRFHSRIIEIYPTIFDDLSKKADDELAKDLELIKSFVQHRRSSDHFRKLFENTLVALDNISSFVGLDVSGASDRLIKDSEVLDTVEEIRLKNEMNVSPDPELMLGLTVLSVYLDVNAKNQLKKKLEEEQVRKAIRDKLQEPAPRLEAESRDL